MLDNEVRRQVAKSPEETMKDFIDSDIDEEENYTYTGKVVNNNDPDKLGKCQIRVYSIFSDAVPDSDLPWALPDFSFIGSKVGNFVVPPVDAIVNVYFDKGDIYLPHYTTKMVDKRNMPTQKDNDYPDNMVMWETDDGDYLTINRSSKETTFNHNSGTKILIKQDGSVEITIVADKTETVQGATETTNQGNITIKSDSSINIEAANTIDIKGTASLLVHGTPVPTNGIGPFCLLPSCVITGAPHQTNKATGGTP
jgi:hypothetical protein